jgi:predicted nucleotidyltransferase
MDLPPSVDRERLAHICQRYQVQRLEVFGSRAKGTARLDSDVDLLVSFEPGAVIGLRFVALAEELEQLFGRDVDLLVRDDAEQDRNDVRRQSIFSAVEQLYAA